MKEQVDQYVKRVKERHQDCRGNEQATKQSLIAPLFSLLGYDMSDPRECKPEYRADFGKGEKASTPLDWAFLINSSFAFFVEAKEVGAKLRKYAEQLGMYFAKGQPHAKLGIYTNGLDWQFYTDLVTPNVMDKEPFLTWNVMEDPVPFDFLAILQKSQFNSQLVRTFAERKHHQSLLVAELNYLLEPSPEFIKLAVKNPERPIETGTLTQTKIEAWKPILVSAIQEWAKQHALAIALQRTDMVEDSVSRPGTNAVKLRSSQTANQLMDVLLDFVTHVEPRATLKQNKYYLGLQVDGSARNFVAFRPRRAHVVMNVRLARDKEIDHQLEQAAIATLSYDSQWSQYRLRITEVPNDRQRELLLSLIRQAWERFGE